MVLTCRDGASERAEKPFPVVEGAFSFCKTNDFARQYHLFCMAILIILCTKINYIAGPGDGFGGA